MEEIDKLDETSNEKFSIAVKVGKIYARFQANGVSLMGFIGGDKTGVINCVCRRLNFITEGSVVLLKDCKVHLRDGKRQIQPHGKNSIK